MRCQPIECTETTIKDILGNCTYVRNILASIRSGWNHITCATNRENSTNSAFVLLNCEIQKIFTLVLQVFVEKEIHRHIAIKLEKLPRFEEDNQNIEFLSTYSSNLNKETNKCSFWLHLKIVLWMRFRKLSHLIVTKLNNGLTNKCSFRLHLVCKYVK